MNISVYAQPYGFSSIRGLGGGGGGGGGFLGEMWGSSSPNLGSVMPLHPAVCVFLYICVGEGGGGGEC